MMYVTRASLKKSVGQLSEGECLLPPVYAHRLRLFLRLYAVIGRAQSSAMHALLRTGLESLGQRVSSVKTYLQSQIKALSSKQDQTIQAQAVMQEHLAHVGADVESTRMEVSEVRVLLETAARLQHVIQCFAACLRCQSGGLLATLLARCSQRKVPIPSSTCADARDSAGAGVQHGAAVAQPAVRQPGHLPPVQGASTAVSPAGNCKCCRACYA